MINKTIRLNGVGASEAAAALGYSQYATPLDIFLQKTGQTPPFEGNAATKRGARLEPIVAQYFQDDIEMEFESARVLTIEDLYNEFPDFEFPDKCIRTFENGIGTDTFQSSAYDFMFCSPDRILFLESEIIGVELKTSYDFELKTADEVMEKHPEWLFQCYYNMAITGLKSWYLAWVNDFNLQVKYFKIDYIEENGTVILQGVCDFWQNHIVTGIAPEPQNADDTIRMNPNGTGELEASDLLFELLNEYQAAKAEAKAAEEKAEALKDRILPAIGDAGVITYGGQRIATCKGMDTTRIDTALLKKELPNIYDQYSYKSHSRPLRISKNLIQ